MKWTPLKIVAFIAILVFYGSILTFKISLPAADDLPRQIKIGELIVHGNFDILYDNIFSYSEPDHRFYNHHWFSGVIFYFLSLVLGWGGLVIFKVAVFLVAFSIIFFAALKKADFWLVAVFSLPTLLILLERTGLRPEVFSYLFIAIFFYILIDLDDHPESNKVYWLIPMQLFWVNMHVFFSIGIMMVGGFLFEKFVLDYRNWSTNPVIRKLMVVLIGVVAISFINPRGAEGVFYRYPKDYPLIIAENVTVTEYVQGETFWEDPSIPFFEGAAVLVVLSTLVAFKQKKRPVFYTLACLATAALGFNILRGIALFGFMFLPAVTANLNPSFIALKERLAREAPRFARVAAKVGAVAVILAFVLMTFPGWKPLTMYRQRGIGPARWAESSAMFFKDSGLKGPIFSDGDIGSYLIYYLYPEEKVFADNRFGDAYSADFYRNLLEIYVNEDVWANAREKYDFNVIFSYHYGGTPGARTFLGRRLEDPDWSLVYVDPFAMILVRNVPENQAVIDAYRITSENIEERIRPLAESGVVGDMIAAADIYNMFWRFDLSREMFLNVLARWPDRGRIWGLMGQMALDIGDEQSTVLAMMFLQRAIEEGRGTAEMYTALGTAYVRMGQQENARAAFRRALEVNPRRVDARDMLNELNAFDLE